MKRRYFLKAVGTGGLAASVAPAWGAQAGAKKKPEQRIAGNDPAEGLQAQISL